MRDFLEAHDLLTADIPSPRVMVLPTESTFNVEALKVAQVLRAGGVSVAVDFSERKVGKKIGAAGDAFVDYALVLGEDEVAKNVYTLKNLVTGTESSGTLTELLAVLA